MSRELGSKEAHGSTPVAKEGAATPGKQTRAGELDEAEGEGQQLQATGEGQGDGEAAAGEPAIGAPSATPANGGTTKVTSTTQQAAADGTADTRKTVAVGEKVDFDVDEADAKATWSASGGTGTATADKGRYTWTAPSTPGSATITFTPGDGGAATTVTMKIVGVDSIEYYDKKQVMSGKGQAGMDVKLKFLPLSVSFWGSQWRETVVDASNVSGFFEKASPGKHKPATPRNIGSDNTGPGDHITWSGKGPFSDGGFTWSIPQQYGVKGSNTWHDIKTFDQVTTIDAKGSVTITKNGESVSS